ncbi:hypothetical protein ABZ848_15880 [Streptomyces sp. NPDC047081]
MGLAAAGAVVALAASSLFGSAFLVGLLVMVLYGIVWLVIRLRRRNKVP